MFKEFSMNIKSASECEYDLVSMGEVMLRLDPGGERVRTARNFRAWEGGGEYNVARGLKRCFKKKTAINLDEVESAKNIVKRVRNGSNVIRVDFYRSSFYFSSCDEPNRR